MSETNENAGRAAVVQENWNNVPAATSTPFVKVDLADRKKKNDAWISAYKKGHGIKKQAVLPSATMQHNEWSIKSGWSMSDATTWRSLCEKVKYAYDDVEGEGLLCLIAETIEMANHCDAHPVGLIHFARTQYGRPMWDLESLDHLKANMVNPEEDHPDLQADQDDVTPPLSPAHSKRKVAPPAPRKRPLPEASQPWDMDDDVIRD